MKKGLALILVLSILLMDGIALGKGTSATRKSGGYEYTVQSDGTACITGWSGYDLSLVIPAALDGRAVSSIGNNAFYDCKSVRYITISDGIKSIGNWAFSSCDSVRSIKIPNSVTSIGDKAFSFCASLIMCNLPNSVTSLGVNPYYECDKLSAVSVEPDHPVFVMIDRALINKTNKELVWFDGADYINSFSIPQGITSIGVDAFSPSDAWFTNITIPNSMTSVSANTFANCKNLAQVIVEPDHPTLAVIDGVLFSKANKQLIWYPATSAENSYAIPQGIASIGDLAFHSCRSLISITIPDGVTSIGDEAFLYCTALQSVTIPDSVTSIGLEAFEYCAALINMTIPDGVTSIGDKAFRYCTALQSVTIPDSVTNIGLEAFDECAALTSVTIPDSVTSIGKRAFDDCPHLTLTVNKNSYAAQYAKDNGIQYYYPDTNNDWLNQ